MVSNRDELLKIYDVAPFLEHPLWKSIIAGELSIDQIKKAELQHVYRTKCGRELRREAVEKSLQYGENFFQALFQTFIEECTEQSGPDHLEMAERLVLAAGGTPDELKDIHPTPGNSAAIALYRDISERGAAFHFLGAGVVEYFYSKLSPKIYSAYTRLYGFSDKQAETYRVHGPMDYQHGERALASLDEVLSSHGWYEIKLAVRDAFIATSLHYDGMYQAAIGELSYWNAGELI
ncbi:iron-containing redox enzyme family protein [Alcanivorax xiamenensis]|uniref:iron-containing redox enzyme family protein n=1 Tax=Alcanivorax xiamenensis TaxID=1177156 RepID=UPI00135A90E7|nr:iron-containing redox enzyme family protein [Alcanivorax xiamenensis]